MRAAALFVQGLRERGWLEQVQRVEVQLYGSLSATGIGHGSDTATIMGLMGEWPDAIDPTQIGARIHTLRETDTLLLDGRLPVPFVWARDMRLLDENLPFHPNAMTLVVFGENGELHRDTYYSVGGGFVVDEAQAQSGVADMDRTELPYDFSSAVELLQLCKTHNLRVAELMLANENLAQRRRNPQRPDEALARHARLRGAGPQARRHPARRRTCAVALPSCTAACRS